MRKAKREKPIRPYENKIVPKEEWISSVYCDRVTAQMRLRQPQRSGIRGITITDHNLGWTRESARPLPSASRSPRLWRPGESSAIDTLRNPGSTVRTMTISGSRRPSSIATSLDRPVRMRRQPARARRTPTGSACADRHDQQPITTRARKISRREPLLTFEQPTSENQIFLIAHWFGLSKVPISRKCPARHQQAGRRFPQITSPPSRAT